MVCSVMAVLKLKNTIGSFLQGETEKVESRHFIQSWHVLKHGDAFTLKFSSHILKSSKTLGPPPCEKLWISRNV